MKIEEVLIKYSKDKSNLIEILNEIQEQEGYISLENQISVSEYLSISMAKIYSVITFYSNFTLEPKGKYNISVCMGTACYVKGSAKILKKLETLLGIKAGETTKDGNFKIVENRCVGSCSIAPVVLVNEKVYGRCTEIKLEEIIEELRGSINE